jgi:hypothetical protein
MSMRMLVPGLESMRAATNPIELGVD